MGVVCFQHGLKLRQRSWYRSFNCHVRSQSTGDTFVISSGSPSLQKPDGLTARDFLLQHPDAVYTTARIRYGNICDFQLHAARLTECAFVYKRHTGLLPRVVAQWSSQKVIVAIVPVKFNFNSTNAPLAQLPECNTALRFERRQQ